MPPDGRCQLSPGVPSDGVFHGPNKAKVLLKILAYNLPCVARLRATATEDMQWRTDKNEPHLASDRVASHTTGLLHRCWAVNWMSHWGWALGWARPALDHS